ncbi:hypothetical protein D3C81_1017860 [compost metagenome]
MTRWRLGDKSSAQPSGGDRDESGLRSLIEALEHWQVFKTMTQMIEVLLWAALFCVIALLVWRYRQWLRLFAGRLGLAQRIAPAAPNVMFGLELTPESLPQDVASAAERLWSEQPRAALGLLYRALLSRLLHEFHLPLRDSTTEGEVLEKVRTLESAELNSYAQSLTHHWQTLAYGHVAPADELKVSLCDGWRRLFGNGVQA